MGLKQKMVSFRHLEIVIRDRFMNAISHGGRGEEGSLGRTRRQRKRIPGGGEPIRVYRREKGKVAATARVAENRGARAIYRGFINSNNVPDSLHRFVFSTWIVIDSSLISRLSLEIIRGSVKELLLARFFL